MSAQEQLQAAWLKGREGGLPAWEEAKAWALREVWRSEHKSDHGLLPFVAQRVVKYSEDKKKQGKHPSPSAISQLYDKMDEDKEWFPGKSAQEQHGPKPILRGVKRKCVAESAMRLKARGVEPTYPKILATCPEATRNPDTKRPVHKKAVYTVLQKDCYDDTPDKPWVHKARYAKHAYTAAMMVHRLAFANHVVAWMLTDAWFYHNTVWTDICNSILPRSESKQSEQALARKGKKGWQSPGSEMFSQNLRGKQECLKQTSWGTIKVWWAPVLSRGKLHCVIFDDTFPGECPAGASVLVQKVRAAINVRFQAARSQPTWVFVDRGKGFYATATGTITQEYKEALAEHGFKAMMGDHARAQPGNCQEIMLHETAVSWLRVRLAETLPREAWLETREEFSTRLKSCCDAINRDLNVEGLCKGFMKRIHQLQEKEGGRLKE